MTKAVALSKAEHGRPRNGRTCVSSGELGAQGAGMACLRDKQPGKVQHLLPDCGFSGQSSTKHPAYCRVRLSSVSIHLISTPTAKHSHLPVRTEPQQLNHEGRGFLWGKDFLWQKSGRNVPAEPRRPFPDKNRHLLWESR